MDKLGALNVFMRAAEAGSFTEAGRRLGISGSAVGKAISRLEDRLGVRLFHRSTRSVSMTPEGVTFMGRCRRIFEEVDAAELELTQVRSAPRGRLRVSLPLVGALFVPTLCAFMREYPEIELDLDFSDRFVDVIEEGFDAVIRGGPAGDSRLMSRLLGTATFCLVASPAYLAQRGTPSNPGELANHACLRYRYPGSRRIDPWPLGAAWADVAVPETVISTTLEPLIAMAERGFGVACVPDFSVEAQVAAGTLVRMLNADVRRPGVVQLLWPSNRHVSPKLRAFIDFMAERLFPQENPPPFV